MTKKQKIFDVTVVHNTGAICFTVSHITEEAAKAMVISEHPELDIKLIAVSEVTKKDEPKDTLTCDACGIKTDALSMENEGCLCYDCAKELSWT